jgi:copper homeostasis protein CutC
MAAVMPVGATRATGADRFDVIAGIEKGGIVESAGIVHRE